MKTITGKESLRDPIFILFVFSLILGVDMGFLKDNLTSSESIMLRESIISFDNLVWLFFALLFGYFTFKEKQLLLRISYLLGAISFLLTASVIGFLGYKGIYLIKIVAMLFSIVFLIRYLTQTLQSYKSALFQNENRII
jgi:hypothetical protein